MKNKNFSLSEKLLLLTSYVLRFKNNFLAKIRKTLHTKGFISTNKLKYAEKLWIYSNQRKIIASSKFNQLKKLLGIFYNKENILRLKGRFSNAEILVWRAHKRVRHRGLNNILNFIRNDYWLCKGRKTVTATLNKCVTCKKSQSSMLLGSEPSDCLRFHLDFDNAFCNTGVEFAGPLYVKDIYGKMIKCLRITYVYLLV